MVFGKLKFNYKQQRKGDILNRISPFNIILNSLTYTVKKHVDIKVNRNGER